jgi:putative beta-barrel porin BBP2
MKRQKQMQWLLGGSLAAAVALAPAAAAAQSTPDQQRPTMRIGPFELRPRLLVSNIGIDYNVFNEHTNPKRDFTFTAAPDLEVSVHPGRLRVAFTSGSELVYFQKYTSERSVNRTIAARADLDLSILKPFISMSSAHTSARPNSEIDVRARHHPRTYTGGTTLKLASRTSMTFTARRSTELYDDEFQFRGVQLSTLLDNKTTAYESSLNLELTPFTTLSLVAGKEQLRFDHAPVRDADSLRITPTVTFSPLGQITGTGSLGYRRFNGLDPSLPDFSGLVSTGAIGLLLGGKYKLDTSFTRDVRYSYEEGLPYYVLTGGRATLAVQTVAALDLRVTGGRESMNYRALPGEPTPGRDWVTLYGGGFGYRIANRIRLVVDVEFSHRTSERDAAREYRNKRIVTSVSWGALNR